MINKPGTAQVEASLKVKRSVFFKMQKDTIVKILSILQCRKIPEGIRIRPETTFSPTENNKKAIFKNKIRIFYLEKVSWCRNTHKEIQ